MKRFKYISLIAIMVLLSTGCGKKEEGYVETVKEKPIEGIVLNENLDIEINSEVNLLSLVSKDNKVDVVSKDEKVDTSVLGEKELVIKYKENDEEKELKFKVKVVDTKAPTVEFKKELSTIVGKEIDLIKEVIVSDNSKEDIKVTVEGDYNFNKEGSYKLKYVAVDSSNNKTEEEFTLKVTKKTTTTSGNSSSNTSSTNSNTSDKPLINSNENNKPQNNTDNKPGNTIDKSANKLITSATHKFQVNYTYKYVKKVDVFSAKSKQDIFNIFYTALNEGANSFSFYCDYSSCQDDYENIVESGEINNVQDYLHPYNTYKTFASTMIDNFVSVNVTKNYSNSDITKLENKVNSIISSRVTSSLSLTDKIKVLHDYIVENTSYQSGGSDTLHNAVGPLINGKSVCEGYSHAMAIFLYKLNVPNYRIAVPGVHMWNLAYVNGSWKHIDVTWDDPIATGPDGNRQEILLHDYFLITSSQIKSLDQNNSHNFNKNVYNEA